MSDDRIEFAPTSTATTKDTEPEVVAGIASGDVSPDQPLSFRVGAAGWPYGRTLLLLGGGLAVGYVAARWLRSQG